MQVSNQEFNLKFVGIEDTEDVKTIQPFLTESLLYVIKSFFPEDINTADLEEKLHESKQGQLLLQKFSIAKLLQEYDLNAEFRCKIELPYVQFNLVAYATTGLNNFTCEPQNIKGDADLAKFICDNFDVVRQLYNLVN